MDKEALRTAGLASARRIGAGDEIAALLYRTGHPLPLSEIEEHVLSRFQILTSSVYMALVQDKAQRFVQDAVGNWCLRRWLEEPPGAGETGVIVMPSPPPTGVRIDAKELDRVVAVAQAALERADEKLRRGLPGVSPDARFQWAILKAAVGDADSADRLLRGFEPGGGPDYPPKAVQAVISLGQ